MGAVLASMIQALSCKDMWRYTCNSCDFKSECGDICNVEIETHEVEVKDSGSETSIEVGGCLEYRHK